MDRTLSLFRPLCPDFVAAEFDRGVERVRNLRLRRLYQRRAEGRRAAARWALLAPLAVLTPFALASLGTWTAGALALAPAVLALLPDRRPVGAWEGAC